MDPDRRNFIAFTVGGAALAGIGGVAGYMVNRNKPAAGGGPGAEQLIGTGGGAADYDQTAYVPIDPALIKYHQAAAFDTHQPEARDIAIGRDGVVIAGGPSVQFLTLDGATAKPALQPSSPATAAAFDPDGNLFIATAAGVYVYNPAGQVVSGWPLPLKSKWITSLAADRENVFLADADNHIVLRCDHAGRLVNRIGGADPARDIPGFVVPSPYFDLALGPDGLLWVANPGRHRVEAFTFAGDMERSWGQSSMQVDGFCGCCNPASFAFLPDGRVATAEKGIKRVKIYQADGRLDAVAAGPDLFQQSLASCPVPDCRSKGLDIAVDGSGRLFVLDMSSGKVRVLAPNKV
jgi:hypothetical protein